MNITAHHRRFRVFRTFRRLTGTGGFLALAACVVLLSAPRAPGAEPSSFAEVTGPCHFNFPADHGPHRSHATEWWYVTGNVQAPDGRPFGFQVTIFRVGLVPGLPEDDTRRTPEGSAAGARSTESAEPAQPTGLTGSTGGPGVRAEGSAWRAREIYLVHTALSSPSEGAFRHFERAARGALNLAGARRDGDAITLFVGGNRIRIDPEGIRATAVTPEFSFDFDLKPLKPPIAHGEGGRSRKGESHGSASCYYSMTRLGAAGRITRGGTEVPVTGLAWMDHEYSSAPLEADLAGWDWFSLQLSDGSDVMIYLMRRVDGSLSPASSGTFVRADGTAVPLDGSALRVSPRGSWKSPRSGATYPSGWTVEIPGLGYTLTVTPAMKDQEMETPDSTRITYWEGSVSITGEKGRVPVSGRGYVELTGYAGPVLLR